MINVLIWVTKRIRKFMTKNNMIENPLSDDDKLLLKLLSKKAKDSNLLGNAGRKYLYECGRYDKWFPNRLFELKITLWLLHDQLNEEKQNILSMIEVLKNKIPKLILNEHVEDQEELAYNISNLFEEACKKTGQKEYLNLLKLINENKTLLSESLIKTTTNLPNLIENIKPR